MCGCCGSVSPDPARSKDCPWSQAVHTFMRAPHSPVRTGENDALMQDPPQPKGNGNFNCFDCCVFSVVGPCRTPRRQRVTGTVCLSSYTQILWGGGSHTNYVFTSHFMRALVIAVVSLKEWSQGDWPQREPLLCITRYLSAKLSCEKELIKSLGLVKTFPYMSVVLQEK